MKVVIAGDHAGFPLKEKIKAYLVERGHQVTDVGTFSEDPVDFPDLARALCTEILNDRADRGIMCCGTGVGASIAVNKIPSMRAALCHDTHCAHQCVEHDNANVLCIGHWIVGVKLAEEIVHAFLAATFSENEDCRRRVEKLHALEQWAHEQFSLRNR
ncbi:MAG: ribose 5-phosphate isomerase B [Opitutales bacterium]|nr:ribose 5-phosphate isomerase B [Opitutales bacterium]